MNNQACDIFCFLNFILKKTKIDISSVEEKPSTFMLLRWLSMSNQENCKIINQTVNRWYLNYDLYGNTTLITKFLNVLLQKYTKKLLYLKKKTIKKPKTKDEDEIQEHIFRECSKREIKNQKQILEELKQISK
jgi:hypothetical protein